MNASVPAGIVAMPPSRFERWLLAGIVVLGLVVSGVIARDRLTWALEAADPPEGHPRYRELADLGGLSGLLDSL